MTINSTGNIELLRLTYKNSDPILATAITNEIGHEFMLKVRDIMNFQNIKVVELAEVGTEVLPQKKGIIVISSLICSVIIGGIVAFIIEITLGKIYKVKDIERILRVPMIGIIPTSNYFLIDGEEYEK